MKKHFLLALLTMLPFLGAWAGDVGTFAELKEALAAGGDVKLTAGIEVTEVLKVDKAVTLDLNGQTITVPEGLDEPIEEPFIVKRGGTFTVNDNFGGGKIDASNALCAIKLTDKGEAATGDLAELVVNGGTIIGDGYAITGNGTRHDTKVTIAGGTLQATNGTGIYNPQIGDLVINGGVIEGFDAAVEVRSGNLTVTGGSFKCTNNQLQAVDCQANGNGTTTKGAALAIVQHETKNPINVSISGGEFVGVSALFINDVNNNNEEANVTVSVTGGTFKGLVEASGDNLVSDQFISGGKFQESNGYQSEGFSWVLNPDEWWTVTGYDVVIQLGTINVPYGDEIRDFTINDFSYSGSKSYETGDFTPSDFTKAELFAAMTFVRVDQGNNAGEHAYTVEIDDAFNAAHPAINTVNVNNGYVNFIPRSLNDDLVTYELNPNEFDYTGEQILAKPVVKFNGETLVENTDYKLSYRNNILPGTEAFVIVNGIGNFKDSHELQFTIKPTSVLADNITVEVTGEYIYNGKQHTPGEDKLIVSVKGEDDVITTLTTDDFDIKSYGENTNAGEKAGTVIVTLGGIYSGEAGGTFDIKPRDISELAATITDNELRWNGQPIVPTFAFTDNGEPIEPLVKDRDYTLNEVYGPGAVEFVLTGKGNYDPETKITLPYTVKKRNFASTDIVLTFDKNEFYYNGASQHPVVKVTDAGRDNVELTEGVDYELYYVAEYSDNPESIETVNAGTYYVQARGIGAYYVNQKTQARVEQSYKYEIKAKPITLTAVDFAAAYGADLQIPEPLYSITDDIEGLTVTEADKDAIKNTLTYQYYYVRWRTLNANTQLNEGTYNYRVRAVENSNYAFTYVNGQLSITDTEFIVKVNDVEMTFGEAVPQLSISAVSPYPTGLNLLDYLRIMFTLSYRIYETVDGELVEATTPYQVGKDYTIKVGRMQDGEFVPGLLSGNYIISIENGKLKVNPASIAEANNRRFNVSTLANKEYTGEPIKQDDAISITDRNLSNVKLVQAAEDALNDYTVEYANNLNAGTATVTITGQGNYTGTRTLTFDITKKSLLIKADDKEASYSAVLNNKVVYTWSMEGLVDADKDKTPEQLGFQGTITVSYNDAAVSVGSHPGALNITANGVSFTNYTPSYQNGNINITQGEIKLAITGEYEITYGEQFDPTKVTYEYVDGDLSTAQQENLANIIKSRDITFSIAESVPAVSLGDGIVTYKPADEPYVGAIVGKTTATAVNYAITIEPADLKVNKAPITLTAQDLTINQGETPSTVAVIGENVELTEGNFVGEDQDELDIELVFSTTAVGTHEDAIDIKVNETEPTTFYDIEVVKGTLIIEGAEVLELARRAECDNSALLADYAGQKVSSVSIKGDVLKKDWWYTLTLPFATTAMDIADAFGYVVVDVPDLTNKDVKKVAFELAKSQEIPANTMILIKMYRDRDLDDKPAVFEFEEEAEIVYEPEKYLEDAAHNKYFTLYANKSLDPTENANCWYLYEDASKDEYIKYNMFFRAGARSSAWNVASLGGYFESASADPDAVRVYVQDEDGTITAIKAMDINPQAVGEGWYTVDGMKLDAAPTQKGVYINNGKKVVVK